MTELPPQTPPPESQPSQPRRRVGLSLAVAALVLGLIGLIPVLGIPAALLAIVLGITVLAMGRPGRGLALGGIAAALVGLLISAVIFWGVGWAFQARTRDLSIEQLHGIHAAVHAYRTRYGDWPDDVIDLRQAGLAGDETLQCRGARTRRDTGYFLHIPPETPAGNPIIAASLPGCLPEGRTVLRLDGQTAWLSEDQFRQTLAEPENSDFVAALEQAHAP